MKRFVAMCLCAAAIPLMAQTKLETFTSPDSDFQFKYSPALVRCTPRPAKAGERVTWLEDACSIQGELCDDDATTGTTIACFAYPKDKLKSKPQFLAAAFFVAMVGDAKTQTACMEGTTDWLIHDRKAATISGVGARMFHTSDAWLSGSVGGEIYRVFHSSRCYELGIQEAEASTGGLDPGTFQEYTAQDAAAVDATLKQLLNSFAFLK